MVTEWWNRASAADLYHVSCLRIPQSLWDHIPRTLRVGLRERVAWHQYHALHGVCQLRGQRTMPPRDPQVPPTLSTAVPAWYTKLRPRAVRTNPTDSVLRNQVGYTGPGERTSPRDGRASQETSHRRARGVEQKIRANFFRTPRGYCPKKKLAPHVGIFFSAGGIFLLCATWTCMAPSLCHII